MKIVDAQVHIWGAGPPTTPTHRQVNSFTLEELSAEMADGGVDAAIIHPPGWDPNSDAMAADAARRFPDRFGVMGHADVDRPESRDLVARWREAPGTLGWRFALLGPGQRSWPSDGTMDWLWPAAEEAGIPISMLAYDFLPTVGRIAERHPRLKLTVDHLGGRGGTTPKKDAAYFDAVDELVALAKYPNIAVKATGAPGYSTEPYPYRSIQPFLQRIFDAFGPERFFWGSDITRMPCPWRQVVTLFTEELPWLRGRDLELVMGEAACRWLDWDIL